MALSKDHPLLAGEGSIGLITGEAPRYATAPGAAGNEALQQHLQSQGLTAEPVEGYYDGPEHSFLLRGASRQQLYDAGKRFGQEAVIYGQGGRLELLFCNGPKDRHFHAEVPEKHQEFDLEHCPANYWTQIPGRGYVSLFFNEDRLWPAPLQPPQPQHQVNPANVAVRKAEVIPLYHSQSFPHDYDWLDHGHAHVIADPGAILISAGAAAAHHHTDLYRSEGNEEAAGAGVSSYADIAQDYGTVTPGQRTDLRHYPLQGKGQDVERLVRDHGYSYSVYYGGGRFGRPDLAHRNYGTKHLLVYDPTPKSGGDFQDEDYTRAWRQSHELAHALTYPEINGLYGEGRRMGRLGIHRSLREAMRAVHWEWLAGHRQRQLLQQVGVSIPDESWNREMNTLMHDAVHRAIHGKFTEPGDEGFSPRSDLVPLETSLQRVQDAGIGMGLVQPDETLRRSERQSLSQVIDPMSAPGITSLPEVCQRLAKSLRERIADYEEQVLALRKAELGQQVAPHTEPGVHEASGPLHPEPGIHEKPAATAKSETVSPFRVAFNSYSDKKRALGKHLGGGPVTSDAMGPAGAAGLATMTPGGTTMARSETSEASASVSPEHKHLHDWVMDFSDSGEGHRRAIKAWERIRAGRHGDGDIDRFHKWLMANMDKDNGGDRKAKEQWDGLRNRIRKAEFAKSVLAKADSIGAGASGGEGGGGAGLPGGSSLQLGEKCEKCGRNRGDCACNFDYLREEGGTREVKPKDPISTAKSEGSASASGSQARDLPKSALASLPGGLPKWMPKPRPASEDKGSGGQVSGNAPSGKGPKSKLPGADLTNVDRPLGKADVPMAKPPSGSSPTQTPMSKPAAATGMPKMGAASKPAAGAVPKPPSLPKLPGAGGGAGLAAKSEADLEKGVLEAAMAGAGQGHLIGHQIAGETGALTGSILGAVHGALAHAIGSRHRQAGRIAADGNGVQPGLGKAEGGAHPPLKCKKCGEKMKGAGQGKDDNGDRVWDYRCPKCGYEDDVHEDQVRSGSKQVLGKAELAKRALPGTAEGDALQAAHGAGNPALQPAPPKLPTPEEHAGRAAAFADFMPAAHSGPPSMPAGAGVSKPLGQPGGNATAAVMGRIRGSLAGRR